MHSIKFYSEVDGSRGEYFLRLNTFLDGGYK